MKSIVFKNLMDIGFSEEDVAIYYNKHFSAPENAKMYKDLDDCFSVLINAKIIDEDEIKEELIMYYQTKIKNNPFTLDHLIAYQNDDNYENKI